MTREEKIDQIVNKCRRTNNCRECKLYGYFSVCPVDLYLKDGTPMVDWSINRAYEILFEEEMKNIEQEKKKMTVEELVKVLDKKSFFTIREPHKRSYIYQSLDGNGTNWEKIKDREVLQVTPDSNGFLIYVAPPVGKDS